MTRSLLTSTRFSPGTLTPEALEALFVGRTSELEEILAKIRQSALTPANHFLLFVGPRGTGKTHLLALAHKRLTTDSKFAAVRSRLRIALLNEEEWGVASFLDLLVRILRSLATADAPSNLGPLIEDLYSTYARDPERALVDAETALSDYLQDRTLLLFCENLIDLFEGLGEEGQKRWRSLIQQSSRWAIVATTPSLFAGIKLQTSPFYGFFTIRHLEPLEFDAATDLLAKKATLEGRTELAALLKTPLGRARARAIHHLAGGNHRVYVVLFDFLDSQSLDTLVVPFMRMVDDLTPYYQERLRRLTPQQRKIVEFLASCARPPLIKDIAKRCLMSHQTAAKQLSDLERLRFVRKTAAGREVFCELAEPLMRICFEVKDNRTETLRLFVEFLRDWFSTKELTQRLETVAHQPRHVVDQLHLAEAIVHCQDDGENRFLEALDAETKLCLKMGDYVGAASGLERLVEELGRANHYAALVACLRNGSSLEKAVERGRQGAAQYPDHAPIWWQLARTYQALRQHQEALDSIDKALRLSRDKKQFLCFRGSCLFELKRYAELLENEEHLLEIDAEHSHSWWVTAVALENLDRLPEAIAAARTFLEMDSDNIAGNVLLARLLARQGDPVAGLQVLDAAKPQNNIDRGTFLCARGVALLECERFEDAVQNDRALLELSPDHTHSHYTLGRAFLGLERLAEAETEGQELIARGDTILGSEILATALNRQGRNDEALRVVEEGLEKVQDWAEGNCMKATILNDLGRHDEAIATSDNLLRLEPDHAAGSYEKIRALVALRRWDDVGAVCESLIRMGTERLDGRQAAYVSRELASVGRILRRSKQTVLAVDCFAAAARLAPKDAALWLDLSRTLVVASRFADASQAVSHLSEIGMDRGRVLLASCPVMVGLTGIESGNATLCTALEALSSDVTADDVGPTIATMLQVVVSQRGPRSLCEAVPLVLSTLRTSKREELVGRALAEFVVVALEGGPFGPEWQDSIRELTKILAGVSAAEIPLNILAASAMAGGQVDSKALLELPLEQRLLLKDYLQDTPLG